MPKTDTDRRPVVRYIPIVIVTIIIVCICWWIWWWLYWRLTCTMTTVMIVRHAEKVDPYTDELSADGQARAKELAHMAGLAGISAIYVTDCDRSRDTAQPLADDLGLVSVEYGAEASVSDAETLAASIPTQHSGETVFVVGHSNTVDDIIEGLGGGEWPELPHTEYDNLYVVTLCNRWVTKVLHLKFTFESDGE